MSERAPAPLVLINRHTGERLALTRFASSAGSWLEIKGSLPPHSQGPPLHIHVHEDEVGRVIAGELSAVLNGRTMRVEAGGEVSLPKGQAHRWWNDSDQLLVFEGHARPVVDLDRHLQALFEVANAGPAGRPPLFYLAHALHRSRHTQIALTTPRIVQRLLFPAVILIGRMLGRYRGTDWPGCPARCKGAPVARDDVAGRAL